MNRIKFVYKILPVILLVLIAAALEGVRAGFIAGLQKALSLYRM